MQIHTIEPTPEHVSLKTTNNPVIFGPASGVHTCNYTSGFHMHLSEQPDMT
jgi:hypothetical protein